MIRSFPMLLLGMVPTLLFSAEPQALFNGKNLDGWTFDMITPDVKPEAIWSVADGLLVSKGKPPGEWNAMRVRCQGDKVTVWVNEVLMNEGTGLSTTQGTICLQSEGAEIHFRKVELKPIE